MMSTRLKALCLAGALAAAWCSAAQALDRATETRDIEQWRVKRIGRLTSETGWLTLVGLYWLDPGENTFGRDAKNKLALNHPALAEKAGSFVLSGQKVSFKANAGSGVTHDGQTVTTLDLVPDTAKDTTILASGPLRFFAIERAGKLGVRVRDTESPLRHNFKGIQYFDIDPSWHVTARFEPYTPRRTIKIMTILGTEDTMDCPGAIVFNKDGQEFRLDVVLENPDDTELFVMFSDGTSGRETYGAGRFMYISMPVDNKIEVDFNKAYNPPCAFNDFATCPLPPQQNRLKTRIEAGEKKYGEH
jgi:uncharacterized protein (DUF1684 family)